MDKGKIRVVPNYVKKITLNDYQYTINSNTFLQICITLPYGHIQNEKLLKRYCHFNGLQSKFRIHFKTICNQDICRLLCYCDKTFSKACGTFNQINVSSDQESSQPIVKYNINYYLVIQYGGFIGKYKMSTFHRLYCHFIKKNIILDIVGHHKYNYNQMQNPCICIIGAVFAMVQIQKPLINTVSLMFCSPGRFTRNVMHNIASKDITNRTKDLIKQEILDVIDEHEYDLTVNKVKCLSNCYKFHKYKTKVAGQVGNETWKKGEEIILEELLYLKLFSDHDKIKQKCNQLWHFNHKLLTIITKFGEHIFGTNENHDNMQLYLNTNSQSMVMSRDKSLFIPLSTFACNEMAEILAEEGETIMKIEPVFQNSYYCGALDARKISDDPDQQEYIIMYVKASIVDISNWRMSVAENKLH